MTTVIGIDPSVASTGCAVWRDGRMTMHTFKSDTKAIYPVRWRQILTQVKCAGDWHTQPGPVIMAIEQPPAKFVGPAAAIPNHGLYAILVDAFWSMDIPYVDVQPTQLKKFATGKGAGPGASKDGVLLAVERRYGHLFSVRNNNEADAATLMAMTLHVYGNPLVPDLPTAHTEKLDNIAWPEWAGGSSWPERMTTSPD